MGNAPGWVVEVNGSEVTAGVSQFVESIDVESMDNAADQIRLLLRNPNFILTDQKLFQPGNEIAVWLGDDSTSCKFVGRGKIVTYAPRFPRAGEMPSIEVVAYSRDHDMMDNEPAKARKVVPVSGSKVAKKAAKKQNAKLKASEGRGFRKQRYSDAVKAKAADYGFDADVDPTPDAPHDFLQKAGLTDYQLVQGMANFTGFVFWVDGDEDGNWTLHFKDPKKLVVQSRELRYDFNTENASLLEFDATLKFSGMYTKVVAESKDPISGKIFKVEFEQNPTTVEDPFAEGGKWQYAKIPQLKASPTDVILAIGDVQVKVIADKRFTDEAELQNWARQWFRRHAEEFVVGQGKVIGLPGLRARQTHELVGLGDQFSGAYYFTRVKHAMRSSSGYVVEFDAHKVIKGLK